MSELPSPLTPEQIVERIAGAASDDADTTNYKYIEPTSTAFDSFID